MNPPRMVLQDIGRAFATPKGERQVLRDINLSIQPEDRIVLYGPSGCGKTTLLHLMAFLDLPTCGCIRFLDRDTDQFTEDERCQIRARQIGMVFQQFHLLPHHSVLDNLQLRLRYLKNGPSPPPDPLRLLEAVGLTAQALQPARVLSGGEKQRLCIARALLVQPGLFLADEPTGNLDPDNAARVEDLFHRVAQQGAAMVIATHDPRWFDFATRIFRFEQGQLREAQP